MIQPATRDDQTAITTLLHELHDDAARGHTLPVVQQHSTTLVERIDDQIVGVIVATAVGYGIEAYAMIEELIVAPTQRSRGIGTNLVDAVHQWARGLGCTVVFVSAVDQSARGYYASTGYHDCTGPWMYNSLAAEPQPTLTIA